MVLIAVESADGQSFFGSLQLASYEIILTTRVGLQLQPDAGPKLAFGAKAMRRLDQNHQQSCADRADRGNLAQQWDRELFSAFVE